MDYNPQTAMTRYQPRYSRQGPIPVPPRPVIERPAPVGPAATEAAPGDALKVIHRHLKGHYRLAVALALVGATIGSFVGFKVSPPEYRSEGSVRIAYSLPLSTQNSGQQMPMTLFDAYIRSQMLEITSRTVVEQAMDDPAWQAIGRAKTSDELKRFAENLSTDHAASSDLMYIHFSDSDPQAAAAAVQSVINVYSKMFYAQEDDLNRKQVTALSEEESAAKSLVQNLQAQIASKDQSGNIQALYDNSVQTNTNLWNKLNEAKYLLSLAEAQSSPDGDDTRIDLSGDQSLIGDQNFRQLLNDRKRIVDQLRQLKADGYGDGHTTVKAAKLELADANQHIGQYADDLTSSIQSITADYDKNHALMLQLGKTKTDVTSLQAQVDQANKDIFDRDAQIQSIQVEQRMGSRLTILNRGEVPVTPLKDRRLMGAGVGAGGGAALFVGFLLLARLARPRYWTSDETEQDISPEVQLLGILPTLTDRAAASNQAGTAHCIHQMRVMLEVAHRDRAPAYLMTSSAPGEGKTGLTAALALSYALSGSRTLVIDADLMGRGLTSGHNADNEPGLCEALIEGSLSGFVRETTTAGLWLLPAGQTGGDGAARLSAIPVQRLLDEARQSFDVILIDSGPILGSVEASVISQKVDGVVFVVSRGQQRPLVRRALAQLRIVSAKMAGVVFNRADSQEFSRVAYMSSMRTRPNQGAAGMTSDALAHATKAPASKPTAATAKPSVNSRRGPMGPLVQSVDNLSAVESA